MMKLWGKAVCSLSEKNNIIFFLINEVNEKYSLISHKKIPNGY